MTARPTPPPTQVIVWHPAQFAPEAGEDDSRWGATNCLASTRAGDRAVLYQSGGDAGVVAVFDFGTDATPHPDLHFAAWGRLTYLDRAIPRAALLADTATEPVFAHIQGRRGLPAPAADTLAALGELPERAELGEPPADITQDWRFYPAAGDAT